MEAEAALFRFIGLKLTIHEIAKRCSMTSYPLFAISDLEEGHVIAFARSTTTFEHPVWTKLKADGG